MAQQAPGHSQRKLATGLAFVLGLQVFALGLLGELIIFTHAKGIKDYQVEEVIQYPEAVSSQPDGIRRAALAS